jgi:ionotropic glutamate receptor
MTREEKPYLMIKEGNFTGNDRFEGFCIDLLKGIAAQVGFQYTIKLVPDGIYGVYNPETKTWNGIGKWSKQQYSHKLSQWQRRQLYYCVVK